MAFIATVPEDRAEGEVLQMYRQERGSLDYLPNYAGVFSHRPRVMAAWAELQRELRAHMDTRSYSLVSLAAALALRSSYCALAHAGKLMRHHFTGPEMLAILRGEDDSPLTAAERAMMRVARKVALDASTVSAADIRSLWDCGLDDAAIFDVVAAAAARCFFAKVPDALGACPDAALGEIGEPLLGLLALGRPPEVPPAAAVDPLSPA